MRESLFLHLYAPNTTVTKHKKYIVLPFMAILPCSETKRSRTLKNQDMHDAVHPCFSHLSEPFLEILCGATYETYILDRLEKRDIGKILKRLSIDLQLMYRLINGLEAPFSNLMNGSIDADNLDNVPRYLVSSGISRQSHLFEDIASSFSREGGTFALRQQQDAP